MRTFSLCLALALCALPATAQRPRGERPDTRRNDPEIREKMRERVRENAERRGATPGPRAGGDRRERFRAFVMKRFDADQDGKLDRAERKAVIEAIKKFRAKAGDKFRARLKERIEDRDHERRHERMSERRGPREQGVAPKGPPRGEGGRPMRPMERGEARGPMRRDGAMKPEGVRRPMRGESEGPPPPPRRAPRR